MKTAEFYLEGKLVRKIPMRVPMFTNLGLYLVRSLIICVRLRASSLYCRMAGVLSMSQLGHLAARALKIDGGNQFTYGVQSTAGGRVWSIAGGNGENLFLERWIFKSRSSNCLGTDLDSRTELCRLSLQ